MKVFETQADLESASLEELRHAANALDVPKATSARRNTLINGIAEKLGILIEKKDDEEPAEEEARIWVRVEMSDTDNSPVFVSVNNDNAYIPRGIWVHLKVKHLMVLQNAIQTIVDKDRNLRQVPAYPHTFRDQVEKPSDSGLARFTL